MSENHKPDEEQQTLGLEAMHEIMAVDHKDLAALVLKNMNVCISTTESLTGMCSELVKIAESHPSCRASLIPIIQEHITQVNKLIEFAKEMAAVVSKGNQNSKSSNEGGDGQQ